MILPTAAGMMMALTIRAIHCAALALFCAGASTAPASAWDPWGTLPPAATAEVPDEPVAADADSEAPVGSANIPEPDWSLLESGSPSSNAATLRQKGKKPSADASAWTGQNNADGTSALSLKQPVSSFWDTRVGADLNVARRSSSSSASDMFREKYGAENTRSESSGTAWAAATAPGVAGIWDKTAIEARIDPGQDQSRLGTTMSKSVPLGGNQYSLTLQNGYNITQQAGLPAIGFNGRPVRSYETDQSAKLSITDSGTSIVASQTLSTNDDKWLRTVSAEQKLFGGVHIAASVSETLQGPANKSLTAGFKHSW
ncbi:hypothetical protein BH11PSE4_BH11PSE4_31300 [soil metagenome]